MVGILLLSPEQKEGLSKQVVSAPSGLQSIRKEGFRIDGTVFGAGKGLGNLKGFFCLVLVQQKISVNRKQLLVLLVLTEGLF